MADVLEGTTFDAEPSGIVVIAQSEYDRAVNGDLGAAKF